MEIEVVCLFLGVCVLKCVFLCALQGDCMDSKLSILVSSLHSATSRAH